jgi:hypothetical protein
LFLRRDAFLAKFDAQAIGGKLSKEKCIAIAAESVLEVLKLPLCPILFLARQYLCPLFSFAHGLTHLHGTGL